ncbi:MAG: nucleotide-binding universal stress UspA family protein [Parvicellaceae bacterium]|jgi:nucleotide-binding universal stress UspA family protein
MTTILLPTDFSDNSLNAISYAFQFYRDQPCYFILLNISEEPKGPAGMMYSLNSKIKQFAVEDMKRFYNEKVQPLEISGNHKIVQRVSDGPFINIVNQINTDENVDLVIMGTQGASGLESKLMGSATSKVIKSGNRPLLAIPKNTRFSDLQRFGLASDLRHIENKECLDPLVKTVDRFNGKLFVVHVFDDNHKIKEPVEIEGMSQLRNNLQELETAYHYIESDNPTEGIESFISNNDIQMLGLITRTHNFFNRLFIGSTTEKLSFRTDTPLFVMRE